jgi:DNA polymerase-3 subunit delta
VHWTLAEDIRMLVRVRQALDAGRPLPMALRESRVWGLKEKLVERLAPRLDARTLAGLLASAHVCDGLVKGLRDPAWPDDAWEGLRRLVLQTLQLAAPKGTPTLALHG